MRLARRSTWTALLTVGTTALVLAQKPVTPALDVKLGLWELSMAVNFNGTPAAPELAAQKSTAQKCLTKDDLSKNLFPQQEGEKCRDTFVTNSKTVLDVKRDCTGDETQQQTLHLESTGPTLAGTIHAVSTAQGKSQTVDVTLSGKWVATACGTVK